MILVDGEHIYGLVIARKWIRGMPKVGQEALIEVWLQQHVLDK
jgi:hypothetical protein